MSPNIVTVFGATGNQGGAVAHSLLKNPTDFQVRAITRNPSSEKAQALAAAGASVVKADGLKKEELIEALKGSWGLYFNTTNEDPTINEIELGKNVVDAAVAADVPHVVYSAGAAASELTKGEAGLSMMDNKAEISRHAESAGFKCLAFVDAGWYLENFHIPFYADVIGGFPLKPSESGTLQLVLPRWGGAERVPFLSVNDDYGDLVHGVFLEPEKYDKAQVQGVSEPMSFAALCQAFEKATGRKSEYVEIETEAFQTYGEAVLEQVKAMFRFTQYMKGRYYGDVETETDVAVELKKAVAGRIGGRETLIGVEEWFGREFGGK